MTIEDETGWANAVIFPNLFDRQRKEILQSTLIMLEGKLQIEGEVIHVIVQKCYNISKMLGRLTPNQEQLSKVATFAFPDKSPDPLVKNNQQKEKMFPEARNFK